MKRNAHDAFHAPCNAPFAIHAKPSPQLLGRVGPCSFVAVHVQASRDGPTVRLAKLVRQLRTLFRHVRRTIGLRSPVHALSSLDCAGTQPQLNAEPSALLQRRLTAVLDARLGAAPRPRESAKQPAVAGSHIDTALVAITAALQEVCVRGWEDPFVRRFFGSV